MTEWANPEGYWDDLAADADADPDGEAGETVADLLREQLDGELLGVAVHARNGETVYAVVSQRVERDVGPTLDLRTVVVDLADEKVRVTGNGLWVPAESGVLDLLTRLSARATTDLTRGGPEDGPMLSSAVDGLDPELLLGRRVDDDGPPEHVAEERNGSGAPRELSLVINRLEAAGVDTSDRFIQLVWGDKKPYGGEHRVVGRDEIYGNYGVYARESDDLVLVDVDDPEAAPDLPPTFEVSSPHGPLRRSHRYYAVPGAAEAFRRTFGSANLGPEWGEVRVANQYVVGPGSELDGCDKDGCEECARDDGGLYEVVADCDVLETDAETLISAFVTDGSDDLEEADESGPTESRETAIEGDEPDVAQEPAATDGGHEEAEETVECARCERDVPESAAVVLARDGDRVAYGCEGGCS